MLNGMVTMDPAQEAAAKKNAAADSGVAKQVTDMAKAVSTLEASAIPAELPKETGQYVLNVEKGKADNLVYSWVQLKQ